MADCECKDPPGGGVECEEQQFAVCRVQGRVCKSRCYTVSPSLVGTQLENWALEHIFGTTRNANQGISRSERAILTAGEWTDPSTGDVVRFRFPKP